MRYCIHCKLPITFVPIWKGANRSHWRPVNLDGSPHKHIFEEVPQ